jgi:hypothetical protein
MERKSRVIFHRRIFILKEASILRFSRPSYAHISFLPSGDLGCLIDYFQLEAELAQRSHPTNHGSHHDGPPRLGALQSQSAKSRMNLTAPRAILSPKPTG